MSAYLENLNLDLFWGDHSLCTSEDATLKKIEVLNGEYFEEVSEDKSLIKLDLDLDNDDKTIVSSKILYFLYCNECNKGFSTDAISDHMNKVHSGLDFKCELCGKCFKRQQYLKIHSGIHTESNIECKLCGMFYNTKQSLAAHVGNYHSKKPKVKCNHCGKLLSTEENLRLHIPKCKRIKFEEFHCDSCGKIFKSENSLKKHILRFHFQKNS